jgi:hypothetical protein
MADAADSKSVFGLTHQNARQRKVACIALQFNLLRDWTKAGPRGSAYAFAEPTDTRTDPQPHRRSRRHSNPRPPA